MGACDRAGACVRASSCPIASPLLSCFAPSASCITPARCTALRGVRKAVHRVCLLATRMVLARARDHRSSLARVTVRLPLSPAFPSHLPPSSSLLSHSHSIAFLLSSSPARCLSCHCRASIHLVHVCLSLARRRSTSSLARSNPLHPLPSILARSCMLVFSLRFASRNRRVVVSSIPSHHVVCALQRLHVFTQLVADLGGLGYACSGTRTVQHTFPSHPVTPMPCTAWLG